MSAPSDPLRLRSLGGEPAPPELAVELRLVATLSPPALAALWSVLGPCLTDPIPQGMGERLDAFAAAHKLDSDVLARAIRACRALLRGAALNDAPAAVLAEDVRALTGPEAPVADLLLRGYDAARAQIRGVAVRAALGEHGRVLEGVDWRLDQVVGSSVGARLRFPLLVLTLRYREQGRSESLTLQVTMDKIRELHGLLASLLAPERPDRAPS